jgi:hypothetical protein
MRRALPVLAALALLLAGCGSSGTKKTSTSGTPATSEKKLTKGEAVALANAIALKASDVPAGYKSSPAEPESKEDEFGEQLAKCAGGAGNAHRLAKVKSPEFTREAGLHRVSMQSSVEVQETPALAQQDLRAIRSERGKTCFSQFLDKQLGGKSSSGATIGHATVTEGTPPASSADGGFALHVSLNIEYQGIKVPTSVEILGFISGSTEVLLFGIGVEETIPASIQQHLYGVLVQRAHAAGA